MPQYYLDANIFIQAKNNSYPLEMFPGFWEWIDQNANDNIISSSSFVYHEIINGEDDLAEWMKARHPSPLFQEPTTQEQQIMTDISHYVSRTYTREEAEAFLDGADPWVIAQAIASGAKVVTMEKLVGPDSKKVKIPNICREFGVAWCDTITMLKELNARF